MAKQRPGKTLNPFAFPSETQVRFILLIWAILGLCWVVGFNYATVRASVIGWPAIGDLPRVERDIFTATGQYPFLRMTCVGLRNTWGRATWSSKSRAD